MVAVDDLAREYSRLLERHGVVDPSLPRKLSSEEYERMKRVYDHLVGEKIVDGAFEDWLRESIQESSVREIAKRVERVLELSGIDLPCPVFAGEFPHGSFNARTCAVAGGSLVLVNRGLMTFLYDASIAIVSRFIFGKRVNGGLELEDPARTMSEEGDLATQFLSDLIHNYVFSGGRRIRGRYRELPDGNRLAISLFITRAAESFAVAHEYGHVVAGHLRTKPLARDSEEWLDRSWAQELEADNIAGLLLLKSDQLRSSREDNISKPDSFLGPHGLFELPTDMITSGPMFYFALDRLITRVGREVRGIPDKSVVSTHPPAETRVNALRELFEELGRGRSMPFADSLTYLISNLEDDVLNRVSSMLVSP